MFPFSPKHGPALTENCAINSSSKYDGDMER